MSRTDKTRPWHVRVAEIPMVTCYPVHDHRGGECTLPDDPADVPVKGARCYWRESDQLLYGRDRGCGCPLCTQQDERRAKARRQRRQGRQQARSATVAVASGVDPIEL